MTAEERWNLPSWTCPQPGCLFNNLGIRSKCRNCGKPQPIISILVDLSEQAELDGVEYEGFE